MGKNKTLSVSKPFGTKLNSCEDLEFNEIVPDAFYNQKKSEIIKNKKRKARN